MLNDLVKIAQISDIHIGPDTSLVQGIDVRANFLNTLDIVQSNDIDLIVLSGDIAVDEAEAEAYAWVAQVLENVKKPWVIMAGNHDDISVMNRYLHIADDVVDNMLFFKRVIKGRHIFFLDSSTNQVQTAQLDWLKREAANIKEEIMLFMHHPPAICGCNFMDTKYPLRNIDEVRAAFSEINNLNHIFVGHYHTEKFIVQDGKNIHLTPSTMMQIDVNEPEFKIEHVSPGWRYISWSGSRMDTEVHYLIDGPKPHTANSIF